jgi:hypothetical protein
MKPALKIVPVLAAAVLLPACAHVKVDPIEVKEIHIVHDVNIRVDKQLDDFFAFQDQHPATQTTTAPSTTQASVETGDLR